MRKNNLHRRIQKPKKRRIDSAQERGVFGVRRNLSPQSYGALTTVLTNLSSEIGGSGRLFIPKSLSVTVIGFSRFDRRHQDNGPATKDVISDIPSVRTSVPALLGRVGIYGSGNKHKLAFALHSEEITKEIEECEKAFEATGFSLRADVNAEDGIVPHLSVALMYRDNIDHFRTPRVRAHLDVVARAMGTKIMLLPVGFPDTHQKLVQ